MPGTDGKLRVAAIGDLHVMEDSIAPYRELFAEISNEAEVLVLRCAPEGAASQLATGSSLIAPRSGCSKVRKGSATWQLAW